MALLGIVGIGASAGGLEAAEQFIGRIAQNTGLAYIVVQHLDPTRASMLPELLQRCVVMTVREATHGMHIDADCIYVIPPNCEVSVLDDTLQLARPSEPRGLRLPIDVLFSSLAKTWRERAIAVILSGMGADGTLGARAIKTAGGLTLVQEPASALFDAMPRSAIAEGCADIVALPEEMPARIQAYLANHLAQGGEATRGPVAVQIAPLQQVFTLMHERTGHDFSLYKPSTLLRRMERRMAIHGIATLAQYADFLAHEPQEADLLFKEVLIGVTAFFRDAAVWEHLGKVVLPALLARPDGATALRAWCAGCSTGEEAYSLAMAFVEACAALPEPQRFTLKIFASDLSPDAIAVARRGVYPAALCVAITPERLARFFTRLDGHFEVNKNIRDMVLFAQHDVVLDPPFTRLDLLVCRNLLIYFDQVLQRRLLPLFHYSLRPGGVLLLGSSETIGRFHYLFTPIEAKLRFYQRLEQTATSGALPIESFPPLSTLTKERPVSSTKHPAEVPASLEAAANHVLLQTYAPAAVVVNNAGDIVYISGRTGNYLEPAAGKTTWNFHAMLREGLGGPFAAALKQAAATDDPVQLRGLEVQLREGAHAFDATVQKLRAPPSLQGMTMIVFRDSSTFAATRGAGFNPDTQESAELQWCRDEIQALREQNRVSGAELQTANEVLQSTNEELQSANEELTTSKEEMQSMNEELQTINNELNTKLDDLALLQSDLQNTLNSIEIAILFLDQHLNVRRYTDQASQVINLRVSDVGRPLSDLTTSLQYPELQADAQETLRTLIPRDRQVPTSDGRWFSTRIMPYRRLDNVIDGVVITLVDITRTKELEAALRQHAPG